MQSNQTEILNFQMMNQILERERIASEIKSILRSFDSNCNQITFKKGIYVYGLPGCGKTTFVINLLKEMNYDVIKYDAGDVRNKSLIDTITSNNISNCNVLQKMSGITKKIAIVMDEIDGMNNGDKGGITSLIKLIRQKKTKKQKQENKTMNPIICIGNYYIDKKIRELIKVCNTFELKSPSLAQMNRMMDLYIPTIRELPMKQMILSYLQGDLRKLHFIKKLYEKKPNLINEDILETIFHKKSFNEDTKKSTEYLLNHPVDIREHNRFMNETDRTIIALLWHENIVDMLNKTPKQSSIPFYLRILDNMCFADYTDRITFQNQIWQFNEMSSMMKTFHNNKIYHDTFPTPQHKLKLTNPLIRTSDLERRRNHAGQNSHESFLGNLEHSTTEKSNCVNPSGVSNDHFMQEGGVDTNVHRFKPIDVRFTKVLTKYSTEYNNMLFIYNLCQELDMDKKDLVAFFQELRLFYGKEFYHNAELLHQVEKLFENYNISKLDIKRMYRYLDKNVKKENENLKDDELSSDIDED